ncbi:oligosaccharide flippase family protein [Candidatus Kaiserbacteria bacterium]|nr:oligosaccharide flippase family protein [Candidatus Kaiserbacteria bacterium]
MVYLASGGFWLGLDQVGGALISFLLAIAFARYVPKDVYGTYRYLLSAFWVLTAFTFTGLPTALSQAVARGKEGAYRTSFLPSLLGGIPLALIALGVGIYYYLAGNGALALAFAVIALLGPFFQPAYLFGSFLVGRKEFRANSLFGLVLYAVPSLALFATMLATKNPISFLAAYLGSNIVTGILLTFVAWNLWRPGGVPDPEVRKLGAHFSAMNLLSTLAQQIDKLVVFHYLGAVELAVYAFATALPEQIKGVFNSVSVLALPKFVARPFNEVRANFWNRLWLFTGALVLVAFLYIAVAPLAFRIFFPAYTEAIFFSQIYALSLIPIGNALPITLLQAREAKRELYIYNVLSPVCQIAALVFLTGAYGLMGAVVARIFGRALNLALGGVLLEGYTRRREAIAK